MSRSLHPVMLDAISQGVVYPFYTVELQFDTTTDGNGQVLTAPLYLWTGNGTVTIDAKDYIGTGQFLDFSAFEETTDISARGASLTLSGIPSDLLSLALSVPYQGRKCLVEFGVFVKGSVLLESGFYVLKEDGGKLMLDSTEKSRSTVFSGYMDQMTITESGDSSQISLSLESRLVDLERVRVRRYTSEDQKSRFTGDQAFQFINGLQDRELFWGRR